MSKTLDLNARVARSENAASEGLEDDFLILDLEGGDYFGIGEIGGFIWSRLDGSKTIDELAEEISREFEVSVIRARKDLSQFLQDLILRKLARVEASG